MKQYGDITKLSGYDLDPVDLIVGGSPCQDLSVAGKRKGLEGERSGLFLEMIRIIREMREKTNGEYPKFALWENVPGATSSNNGNDFGAVLGEFARLIEPKAPNVPVPQMGWPNAGILLVGGGGQIAYRTHDAQYWGVPQRRRRIALVTDLRGQSASEILFERKGVSGNSEPGEAQREGTAESIGGSVANTSELVMIEMTSTKNTVCQNGTSPTLTARMGTGGNQVNAVFDPSVHHGYKDLGDVCETVRSRYGTGGNNQPLVVATLQGFGDYAETGVASSVQRRDYKYATDLVCRTGKVRRLTPLEAERLQGLPDNWTNIPGASDSQRYRAIGNGIALPFWEFLAKRFVEIGEVKNIGSLFDGIGGFPLVFKRAGCETLWTSEIEPFCERVVKHHVDKGDL